MCIRGRGVRRALSLQGSEDLKVKSIRSKVIQPGLGYRYVFMRGSTISMVQKNTFMGHDHAMESRDINCYGRQSTRFQFDAQKQTVSTEIVA